MGSTRSPTSAPTARNDTKQLNHVQIITRLNTREYMKSKNTTKNLQNILANIALLDLVADIQSGDTKIDVNLTLKS